MLSIEQAIQHCEEKAKELRAEADMYYKSLIYSNDTADSCLECAKEHEQLAEWLTELRKLKKCRECPLIKEECAICGKENNNEDSN